MNAEYVLVTAARDEGAYIERTIRSVISQTRRPETWIIVSDGSTDRTEDVVASLSAGHGFIRLEASRGKRARDTSSKVRALKRGIELLRGRAYQFVGNVDADVEIPADYYEKILERFRADGRLGIAGGWIHDFFRGAYRERSGNAEHSVPGAIQMFRRACFEEINGYLPIPTGGEDAVAEIMARMRGWAVRSFRDLPVRHNRPTGTEGTTMIGAGYRQGREDYFLGYHPLFEILKCLSRTRTKPYLLGGLARLLGYLGGISSRQPVRVPETVVTFLRNEQMSRIRRLRFRRRPSVLAGRPGGLR